MNYSLTLNRDLIGEEIIMKITLRNLLACTVFLGKSTALLANTVLPLERLCEGLNEQDCITKIIPIYQEKKQGKNARTGLVRILIDPERYNLDQIKEAREAIKVQEQILKTYYARLKSTDESNLMEYFINTCTLNAFHCATAYPKKIQKLLNKGPESFLSLVDEAERYLLARDDFEYACEFKCGRFVSKGPNIKYFSVIAKGKTAFDAFQATNLLCDHQRFLLMGPVKKPTSFSSAKFSYDGKRVSVTVASVKNDCSRL
jgi:hypothetical protein